MNLLLITGNFPFGNDGDNNFVKNEIAYYEKAFEKITILATCKENKIENQLPSNANAFHCDISKLNVFALIKSLFTLFFSGGIKEYLYARKKLNQKNVLNIFKSVFKYYYCYFMLSKQIVNFVDENTVCLSYWLSSRAFTLARLKEKGKISTKCFSRCHGFDCYLERGYLPFRREIDSQFSEVFFISEFGKCDYQKNIIETFNNSKANYSVSKLGIEISKAEDSYAKSEILTVVSCSSVIKLKRIDIIIDALANIQNIEIKWVHFGGGAILEEMWRYAQKKLGNMMNIHCEFCGFVKNDQILQYYKNNNIDLLLNVSDTEGIPVSVMEGYNYYIPAIGRNVGAMKEIIRPDLLLTTSDIIEELVEKIRYYCGLSLEQKKEIRKNVKEILTKNFDIEKNIGEFLYKMTI